MTLATNIVKVKSRISAACAKSNRSEFEPNLLAVSKTQNAAVIAEAFANGITAFGENYLQEAIEKIEAHRNLAIQWHFIGPIQSNKTRDIAHYFNWVHSIDRSKIAKRLNEQRQGEPLNVCIQVNISGEASKSGCNVSELKSLAALITTSKQLKLRGLMAIPAAAKNNDTEFAAMHKLFIELQTHYPDIDTLSMGMSTDLEEAIANGSTLVRIGTDIFGSRTKPTATNNTEDNNNG